jgi:chemotaxis protein CheC
MSLTGDVSGMIMFLIHKPFVKILLNNLLGMDIEDNFDLDEMSQSAIKEVGNIIAASYVNAIAELTGLAIEISPPELSVDMVGSVLSLPAIYYANISDKIIFIKDELDKEDAASSQIILIPDVDSLKKIMESLGLGDI